MSHPNPKAALQEDTLHKPFLVRLATSEEMAQNITICKKCENIRKTNGATTIHSTLAYSRCRCHRVFRYRDSQQKLISCGSQVDLLVKSKQSPNTVQSQCDLHQSPAAGKKIANTAPSMTDPNCKLQKDNELAGSGTGENGTALPVADNPDSEDGPDRKVSFDGGGGGELCKVPHIQRYVECWS